MTILGTITHFPMFSSYLELNLNISLTGCHAVSSLSASVVSVSLHHLLEVYVHKHVPGRSTRTEESEDLLNVPACEGVPIVDL